MGYQQGYERSPFELTLSDLDVSAISSSQAQDILAGMTPDDQEAHHRRMMHYGSKYDREAMPQEEMDSLLAVESLFRAVGQ